MKLILAAALVTSAFASEQKPKDLLDHYKGEIAYAEANGLKRLQNDDRGYLVKVECQELIKETDEYALYKSQLRFGQAAYPVVILMDSAFKEQFESMKVAEKKKFDGLRRISSEGGGHFDEKPPYEMFILAKPRKGHKYVSPFDGKTNETFAFEAVQVCKSSDFTNCFSIKKDSGPSLIKKIFGG